MKLLISIFLTFFIASNSSQAQTPKDMLTFEKILEETKEKNFVKVLERFETTYGIKLISEVNTDDITPMEIEEWSLLDVFSIKEINASTIQFKILELNQFADYEYLIFSRIDDEYYYIDNISVSSRYQVSDVNIYKMKNKFILTLNIFGGGGTGANNTLKSF